MLKFYLWRCVATLVIVTFSFYLVPVLAKASSPPTPRPPLLFIQGRFSQNDEGNMSFGSNLFRLDPDGASSQLTHFSANESAGMGPLSISPNQQQIVFSVWKDSLFDSIYRMNLDDSNLTRLVGEGLKGSDSTQLIFASTLDEDNEKYVLYQVNVDGSNLSPLTEPSDTVSFGAWLPE